MTHNMLWAPYRHAPIDAGLRCRSGFDYGLSDLEDALAKRLS